MCVRQSSQKKFVESEFCMEMLVESVEKCTSFWAIFVHANTEAKERSQQWDFLEARRNKWEAKWIIGGDFNDIRNSEEKKGGGMRK